MKVKTPVSLMVAVVLGLITAYFGMQAMHNSTSGRSAPITRVLVAKRDMAPGYVIQPNDLGSTVVPVDLVPDKAMHEIKEAAGRTVVANIVTGQTLVDAMMAPTGGAGGLAAIIPAGMRASTIDVSDSSAVAGLLTPGCRVDVIATLHKNDQNIVKAIVENVQVQSLQRGVSGYTTVNGVSTAIESGAVKTVTLLVSPKQASSIELAKSSGAGSRLTLTLRGQGDSSTADNTMSEHEMVGISDTTQPVVEPPAPKEDVFANTPPPPEDKGRPVQILRGGTETFIYMKDKGTDEEAAKTTPPAKTPAPKGAGKSTPPDQEPQTASGTTAPELHSRVEERSNIR